MANYRAPMRKAERPLLTVNEVANWLQLKPSTIYAWAASGRLPHVRVGGRIRFQYTDILGWLEARKGA